MKFFKILFALLFAPKVLLVPYEFTVLRIPGFQIWEIEEGEVPVEVLYNRFMEFSFKKAFIVIFKHFNLDMDIFYWLGTNTSLEKRKHTAYYTGQLIVQLCDKEPRPRISSISREVDTLESEDFCEYFNLTHTYLQKLYRVSGSSGQYVMQVPCTYENLNYGDSFVLDFKSGIYVWNTYHSNNCKRKMATTLARRINRIEYHGRSPIFTLDCGPNQNPNIIESIRATFLKKIPDALIYVPTHFAKQSDNHLYHIKHKEIKLKEYSMTSNEIVDKYIDTRPLQLSIFEENKAYVLKVFYNRNTFVYLGKHADAKVIQRAMVKAEKSFLDTSTYDSFFLEVAWKKITIIYGDQKLPMHFLVNFNEEVDKLRIEEET